MVFLKGTKRKTTTFLRSPPKKRHPDEYWGPPRPAPGFLGEDVSRISAKGPASVVFGWGTKACFCSVSRTLGLYIHRWAVSLLSKKIQCMGVYKNPTERLSNPGCVASNLDANDPRVWQMCVAQPGRPLYSETSKQYLGLSPNHGHAKWVVSFSSSGFPLNQPSFQRVPSLPEQVRSGTAPMMPVMPLVPVNPCP